MPLLVLQNSLQETLELISFPKTFRDKDKAKGETVDLMIEKKKRRVVASEERHRVTTGATALEPHPCFLDSQQLCFFFFCFSMCVCVCVCVFFSKVQIQRKQGTVRSGLITVLKTVRSNRSSHGSLLFSYRAILETKRTTKMSGLRFSQSDRTIRSWFQNLDKEFCNIFVLKRSMLKIISESSKMF